ncbi:MAG: sulfatase [Verrucomicrobia bacterium]|nr:sulfatase [Verrucomicrobiota bacterium]MCH8526253.1 sulfatase [Kiritimatiellia bacterium]
MKKPHLIVISTHDSGKWFGCYGHGTVHTPHIDRLASEGVTLDGYFSVSPICSPSRGAAMTGLAPQRNGLVGLTHHGFRLNDGVKHAAELLRERGYEPVLFSFQHEADEGGWKRLGFERYEVPQTGDPQYPFMFKSAPEVAEGFAAFLETRSDDRPFYAQIGFNETHTPFWFGGAVPDRSRGVEVPPYLERTGEAEHHFAGLQGAIRQADEGVGRILAALDAHGLRDETIVVFTSDHGIESRRDKWTLYDPGLEIPCIFRGPGIPAGRRLGDVQSNLNFLPTLLQLAGLPPLAEADGTAFADRVCDPEGASPDEAPFFGVYYNGACRCIRTRAYKLIWNLGPEPYRVPPPERLDASGPAVARPVWELYDLRADPDEFNNLAGSEALRETESDLRTQLLKWLRDVGDPCTP